MGAFSLTPNVRRFLGLDEFDSQQQASPPDEFAAPLTPVQSWDYDSPPTVPQAFTPPPAPVEPALPPAPAPGAGATPPGQWLAEDSQSTPVAPIRPWDRIETPASAPQPEQRSQRIAQPTDTPLVLGDGSTPPPIGYQLPSQPSDEQILQQQGPVGRAIDAGSQAVGAGYTAARERVPSLPPINPAGMQAAATTPEARSLLTTDQPDTPQELWDWRGKLAKGAADAIAHGLGENPDQVLVGVEVGGVPVQMTVSDLLQNFTDPLLAAGWGVGDIVLDAVGKKAMQVALPFLRGVARQTVGRLLASEPVQAAGRAAEPLIAAAVKRGDEGVATAGRLLQENAERVAEIDARSARAADDVLPELSVTAARAPVFNDQPFSVYDRTGRLVAKVGDENYAAELATQHGGRYALDETWTPPNQTTPPESMTIPVAELDPGAQRILGPDGNEIDLTQLTEGARRAREAPPRPGDPTPYEPPPPTGQGMFGVTDDAASLAAREAAVREARDRWLAGLPPRSADEQLIVEEYGRRWETLQPHEQGLRTRQTVREAADPRERVSAEDLAASRPQQPYTPEINLNAAPGFSPSSRIIGDVANSLGGGVFGAGAGLAAPADTPDERRRNALIGAGIGMVGGPVAGRLMPNSGGALATPGVSPNRMSPPPRPERAAELATPIRLTDAAQVARIRLDKFPEEIRDDLLAAARGADFGTRLRRGVLSDEAIQTLAAEYAPTVDAAIRASRRGKAYSAEEIVGLRNLLVGQNELVRSLGAEIAARTLPVDQHTATLARMTLEQQKLVALAEVVYGGAPAEAGRALRQFRQQAQSLEADPSGAGLRYLRQQFGTLDKAEEVAVQYQQMVADGADPIQLATFLRTAKGGWLNRLSILRYSSMLSSTTTHLINGTGNLLMQGVDVATTPLAVGVDVGRAAITGVPRQVFMAELPARLHGMAAGATTGLADASFIMRNGLRPEDVTKLDQLHQGFGTNIPGIAPVGSRAAGVTDFLMEGPLRALSAADAVFRSTARGGHLAAEATAAAMKANGGKKASAEAIQRFMTDPKIMELADAKAARSVLQEQRQEITAINGMIRNLPPAGQQVVSGFVPFIRTPYNLVAQGVGMTPAGLTSVVNDIRLGKSPREIEERLGRIAIGTAVMGLAAWDYLSGNLTGPRPETEAERSTLPPGWREWSRKVTLPTGETQYIPLASLGPLAIPAVISILIAEGVKQGKSAMDPERAAQVALGMGQFASDQTFLRGVSDLAGIFDRGGSKIENALENLATQLSPHVLGGGAIGRQLQQIMGMPQRDPEGAIEALLATHPLTAGQVPPRRDVIGRPVVTAPGGLETAIAPFRASVERDAPVIRAFRSAKEGLPMRAPKQARDPYTGEARVLTRSQQNRWRIEFGQALRNGWDAAGQPNDPKTLRRIESDARDAALAAALGG